MVLSSAELIGAGSRRTRDRAYGTAGTYAVTLTAADDGATATDTAIVNVQTVYQAIGSLSELVASCNIQQGIGRSLEARLQNAQRVLVAANAGQRQDAATKLLAFSNAVEAQRGKALTNAQADELVALTRRIVARL